MKNADRLDYGNHSWYQEAKTVTPTNVWGEPGFSYKVAGWNLEIAGWNEELQADIRPIF
jgi:hypothetical protein